MVAFLSLFIHVLVSPFKTQARLEAEIVLRRHQLNVLRRRVGFSVRTGLLRYYHQEAARWRVGRINFFDSTTTVARETLLLRGGFDF